MYNDFVYDSDCNDIYIGKNIKIQGSISGSGNEVKLMGSKQPSLVRLNINGNNNKIVIGEMVCSRELIIKIGSYIIANLVSINIDDDFSCENGCVFYLYNSGNNLKIGDKCMMSNNITIRCGESPHLIFDKNTGDYLDNSVGVFIGNHVWIGEKAYITKRVTIPDDSIVAAMSVVTKRFDQKNVVIGGNPAKIVKSDIEWIRNPSAIPKNSNNYVSYNKYQEKYK